MLISQYFKKFLLYFCALDYSFVFFWKSCCLLVGSCTCLCCLESDDSSSVLVLLEWLWERAELLLKLLSCHATELLSQIYFLKISASISEVKNFKRYKLKLLLNKLFCYINSLLCKVSYFGGMNQSSVLLKLCI